MKKLRDRLRWKNGFTLMELMVVIVVIGVLVGLLIPAILKAKEGARQKKARAEVYELQKAWAMYYQTYEKLPGHSAMDSTATQELGGNNKNKIVFMEFTPKELSGGFKDPWKELYLLNFVSGQDVTTKWKFQTRVHCMNASRGKY